jgi:two-component system CheB/CheR fusion protein
VCVRVRDDGAGMTPELIEHAFELFAQGDRSLARSSGGLGIGLTLVQRLVEMHGGSVQARSEGPGMGSEFVVQLPIAQLSAQPFEPQPVAPEPPPVPRTAHGLRVLVVDDNEDAADSLQLLLSAWKHDVRVAHDGVQALAVARAFKPQLALLDIGLPEMSGYELAQRLRALPELQPLRLVALSGYSRDSDRRQAEQDPRRRAVAESPERIV